MALARSTTNATTPLLATDSGEATLSERFHHLLVDTLPNLENAAVESIETAEGEMAPPLCGRPSRKSPPQLPMHSEEPAQFWLALYPIPTTTTCQSKLGFGLTTHVPDRNSSPEQALRQAEPAGPSVISSVGQRGELQSVPEVSTLPAQGAGQAFRVRTPPVVLEGLLWDHAAQTAEAFVAPAAAAKPAALQFEAMGEGKAKFAPESVTDEPRSAQPLAKSESTKSGQKDANGDNENQPESTPHWNKTAPSTSDSNWTNYQTVLVEPRSSGLERLGAASVVPHRSTPIVPTSEPGSEAGPNQPRSLTVRIHETVGKPVDVRFVESRGTVKVTVRTEDNQLAAAIATGLPGFERRLESRGWTSELHAPLSLREARPSDEIPISNRSVTKPELAVPGMDLAQNQQDPARRQRTNWDEEIEDRTNAAALRRLSISREEL